ncbi:MAG: polysaccharide deacetylase family protein [Lachnospiraceae bacterium]|nr:polysaccharide deacetylase family protein [Lachnospiraceae bacterium]
MNKTYKRVSTKAVLYWLVMSILFFDIVIQGNRLLDCALETDAEGSSRQEQNAGQDQTGGNDAMDSDPYCDIIRVALTFDDGPHPVYTPMLLDGLQERGVKATFFVTGENAEAYPELIERMRKEGHLIGNHTYSHVELSAVGEETFFKELEQTSQILEELTGEEILFVRPPYGEWNKEIEALCNMFPVLWDVDSLDWSSKNTQAVAKRVLKDVEDGDIILMHDSYLSTVEAALYLIDVLTEQGYEFVTVDELLFD